MESAGATAWNTPRSLRAERRIVCRKWLRLLEVVTIHEFGHQYFYGLLASNEAEEAWLDEGINSYLEQRILDIAYGQGSMLDLPWVKVDDSDAQRLSYVSNRPESGAIFTKSWQYERRSDYGKASYAKPATVLATLERHLGWEKMKEVLRTYYEEWRFRHPTTRDFKTVAERISGQSLDWFFDQYIYGTAVVDYAIDSLSVEQLDENVVQSSFVAKRLGTGYFPQKIRVLYEDGKAEDIEWDGRDTEKEFVFERPAAISEVYLDPDEKIWLDINRLDNRLRRDPETRFAWLQLSNVTVWIQQWLTFAGGIF